jgi:hypothetical protein
VIGRPHTRAAGKLLGSVARRRNTKLARKRHEDALPVVGNGEVDVTGGG